MASIAPENIRIEASPSNPSSSASSFSPIPSGSSHGSSSSTQATATTLEKRDSKKTILLKQLAHLHTALIDRHDRITGFAIADYRAQQQATLALATSLTGIDYYVENYRDEVSRKDFYQYLAKEPEWKIRALINDMEKIVGKLEAILGGMRIEREEHREEERQVERERWIEREREIEQERQMEMEVHMQIQQELQIAANRGGSGAWFGGCTIQ